MLGRTIRHLSRVPRSRVWSRPLGSIPNVASGQNLRLFSDRVDISYLERESQANPHDPRRSLHVLEELNKQQYHGQVVSKFENSTFSVDESCARHYLYAVCSLGLVNRLSLTKLGNRLKQTLGMTGMTGGPPMAGGAHPHMGAQQSMPPMGATSYPSLGSPEHPIVMRKSNVRKNYVVIFNIFVILALYGAHLAYTEYTDSKATKSFKVSDEAEGTGIKIRFSDVKGCTEAKDELQEIVRFLKDPESFTKLGGKLPRGVLLTGSPGTGKTLLARAVAGEAEVPFLYSSGSEFEEVWVGVGAKRVRDLFEAAREYDKCIIFIDELDAVGGKRNPKESNAHRQTINQLLVEMDGFNTTAGIIVIAATNFANSLDTALTRPGRFDRQVPVTLPDLRGRKEILDLYVSKITAGDIDTALIARGTPGASGAHLESMVNEAAVHAAMLERDAVQHSDVEWAKDKVIMGTELRSMYLDSDTKRQLAFREGGHAICALNTPGADPILKATIIPAGMKLSNVHQIPVRDQVSINRQQIKAKLDVHMGGRCAEELMFGSDNISSGVSDHLEEATNLARRMVLQWGMGSSSPLRTIEQSSEIAALSPEARQSIDTDVRDILQESFDRTTKLLKSKKSDLVRIANALLEHESLTGDDIQRVLQGKPPLDTL